MAPSLRSSAKVPRRAARLATARIEQSSLRYKLLIKHSPWPSSGNLSSQGGVSQPSNLQHATQKGPRLASDTLARRVPKVGGTHLKNSSGDVDVPAQSSKNPETRESRDRAPRQPVLQLDTEDCHDLDDLAQSRKAELQNSHNTMPEKHLPNSDTGNSDDVDDLTQSKKPKSKESPDGVPQKPVLNSDAKDSDDVDDPTHSKKAKLPKSCDSRPWKPMLKSDTEDSDDVYGPTHSKKTEFQKSRDRGSRKPMLESDTEDSADAGDLAQSKKPKSQESADGVPQKPLLNSDAKDSDDVDNPIHSKNTKLQKSRDRGPRKPMLESDTEDSADAGDLAQSKKPKSQEPADGVPRKPVLNSDAKDSDDVDDPAHSKETKLQKSYDRGPRKPMLKSDTKGSDVVDNPTHTKKTRLQKPRDRAPRKTMLKPDSEGSDDVDEPTHSKKTKLQESHDRAPRKPKRKSDTGDPDDVGDRVQSKKTKLRKSCDRGPRKTMLNSDAKGSDDVGDLAQSKKAKSLEPPDRVPRKPMLKSDTEDSDDLVLAQCNKAHLQESRDKVRQKPVLMADTEDSGDVDNLTHSKKTKLRKSHSKEPRKTMLKSDTEGCDDGDEPNHSSETRLQEPHDRVPRKPKRKSDTEGSDDVDKPTDSNKTKLQESSHRGPQKLKRKSDTEDSDVGDLAQSKTTEVQKSHDSGPRKTMLKSDTEGSDYVDKPPPSNKAKLQESHDRGPQKPMQMSDSEDSDNVDDPTHSKKVKLGESPDQVPRKPTLGSNARTSHDMQLGRPWKVDLKRSSRLAGQPKEPQNTLLKCEAGLGETAQTSKGHKAAFRPFSSSSAITQRVDRKFEVPAGTWHNTTVIFAGLPPCRKPDARRRDSQYRCSVTGCPHAQDEGLLGFWLFPLPDEEDEASLRSAWLQSVPVDLDINRPLSPRVCFKHFHEKKDFVSVGKRIVGLKPDAVPSKALPKGYRGRSMTAAEAARVSTIAIDAGHGSQSTTAADGGNDLESTTVVAMKQEPRSTTGIGKESEPMSTIGTAQEPQTTSAASIDSESQCRNAVTPAPELASENDSKSAAELSPTFQASAQLIGENCGAGQQNKDDVCASPVSLSTESFEEAAKCCPTVITEPLLETQDTNTGTCEPLASDNHLEKCALESVSMQATNASNKPEEEKRDIACSLVTRGPVDDEGSTTISHCADVCGLPKSVPKETCNALTQPVLVTDNETPEAMLGKLEIDLETRPQVSKDAVASCVSAQMCSTNKLVDTSNSGRNGEGMKVTTERHRPDPPHHVESNYKNIAPISAIRTAAKVCPTLDAPAKPLLRKEAVMSNVAVLSRGLGNLVNSSNSETKTSEQDGICKRGLPNFSLQSYGYGPQRGDGHVLSRAFNVPVVKAGVDGKSWPRVPKEPTASCSAIVRHRTGLLGGNSADEAETSKPTKPAAAGHLFDPSQGRHILKKEVLQDGDELGMSAVLCTVVWVPTVGAKP